MRVFREPYGGPPRHAWDLVDEVQLRINHAMNVGCHIEALSLRIQHIDYWLRVYLATEPVRKPALAQRNSPFGTLLNDCKTNGFHRAPNDLVKRLRDFAHARNEALHNFMKGAVTYAKLYEVLSGSASLHYEVIIYVLETSGVHVWSAPDGHPSRQVNVGDVAVDAKALANGLRSKIGWPPVL